MIPALQAAISRRTRNLSQLHQHYLSQPTMPSTTSSTPDLTDLRRRQLHAHDGIKRCVGKIARYFEEIEELERMAPVPVLEDTRSMREQFVEGRGLGPWMREGAPEGFLECWLEEVLARVEEVVE